MANTQPAKVSYFFGKGYADLGNTIKESWSRNLHSAGEQFTIAREKGCFTIGGGMNLSLHLPLSHTSQFCCCSSLSFMLDSAFCGLLTEST